jgi:hypothetical protein
MPSLEKGRSYPTAYVGGRSLKTKNDLIHPPALKVDLLG